ncbi:Golgi transport complex subunit 4 [Yamadazyma tenuis]|uniref:Conserved oligomeric Golgi complex subunit 4 n=1 Tax=Candida tenuis (strain ATCC 10573 / BCRC 21748 / CBS 615 / JCM 9827 / NBRC 10315 / NRRL Y-1498 / VKM Y-70) TaxID=590646 RepID=G3BC56_CANTC|nr:uncharacterized protein CANTEDRAFT_127023 [Yamadazyma tenuis ATCC 10573]EGV60123.1 hypothetical protein CANTEDRAFT_127023 [Yamadazyma tenuis ATCC 10573]WEJ94645.1 Golgi transport complex subunit 4 [Yamadazyma tenuis]
MSDTSSAEYTILSLSHEALAAKTQEIVSSFESASSEHELHQLVSAIDQLNHNANRELHHYVHRLQARHQSDVAAVELNRAKLADTLKTTNDLITVFSDSNNIGSTLTYKLKALDKEISRVTQTSEYVSSTKLLKNNINQAVYAMEHKSYQLAANCIRTIKTKVPDSLIDGDYAASVIPSTDIPEFPRVVIDNLVKQLIEVFKVQFDDAAAKKDMQQLTKFFELFPLIGQEEVGLNCYSKFISQVITDTSRSLIQSISSGSGGEASKKIGLYSRSSMQLFENISMMLAQHAPLINRYYASTYSNALPYVINKIQPEIDSQIGLITDTFYDEKRLGKIIQDIRLYDFPILRARLESEPPTRASSEFSRSSFEDNELVTIVEAGDLFSEFANIFNYWSLYCKFISTRYLNASASPKLVPKLLVDSNFTRKIQSKYLPAFETIFNFYFRRSLEKAITIEALPALEPYLLANGARYPEQPPCSSVIEDLTLVLNTCIKSIIDSSQITAVKSFVTESFKVIKNDLINGYFIKELNEHSPRYNSALSLINPKTSLLTVSSPRTSRGGTPAPDPAGGMGFFKGAQSALGTVVGGGASNSASSATISNNPKLVNFVLYLNTVAVGQEYFTKILDNITKNDAYYIRNCFPFGDDASIVQNILQLELFNPFVSLTNKLIQESLINFYNQSIKAKMLTIVGDFLDDTDDSNYLIYSTNVLNDNGLILQFTSDWRNLIRPYGQVFHHELIFGKLLKLIILNLANIIEKRLVYVLKRFKINEFGSLKLEKDISGFISEVCEDNYELREKFIRVTQLVLLVGMDEEEYEESIQQNEHESDEDGGINWVFTPSERRQFRNFRI